VFFEEYSSQLMHVILKRGPSTKSWGFSLVVPLTCFTSSSSRVWRAWHDVSVQREQGYDPN